MFYVCYTYGKFTLLPMAKYWTNHPAIWSHCSSTTPLSPLALHSSHFWSIYPDQLFLSLSLLGSFVKSRKKERLKVFGLRFEKTTFQSRLNFCCIKLQRSFTSKWISTTAYCLLLTKRILWQRELETKIVTRSSKVFDQLQPWKTLFPSS